MQQPFTSTLAVTCIMLGVLGLFLSSNNLTKTLGHPVTGNELQLCENLLSVVTKCGLILAGVLMHRRSPSTWHILVAIVILSSIDSAVLYLYLFPLTPPQGPSSDGQSARDAGRIIGLFIGPWMYLLLIGYISMCASEFSATPKPKNENGWPLIE